MPSENGLNHGDSDILFLESSSQVEILMQFKKALFRATRFVSCLVSKLINRNDSSVPFRKTLLRATKSSISFSKV